MSSLTEKILIIGVAFVAWKKFFPDLALATPTAKSADVPGSAQSLLAPLGSENPENLLQLGTPLVASVGAAPLASLPLSNPVNPVESETSYQGGAGPGSGAPAPSGSAQGAGDQGGSSSPSGGSVSLGFDAGKGLDGAVTGAGIGLSVGGIAGAVLGAVAGFLGAGVYGGSSMGGEGEGGSSSGSGSAGAPSGGFDGVGIAI